MIDTYSQSLLLVIFNIISEYCYIQNVIKYNITYCIQFYIILLYSILILWLQINLTGIPCFGYTYKVHIKFKFEFIGALKRKIIIGTQWVVVIHTR